MKRYSFVIIALLLAAGLVASAQIQTDSQTASEILDRVNSTWQGDSFHGVISLDIVLGGQTKSHKLEVWTLGSELALIRVLEPAIDRNSGYLQLGDELWYYAPEIGSIKLPAIAIGDALFGAGPSLEDMSHGTLSNDYDATAETTPSGYFLTLIPHEDAPVVYGRLEISVNPDYVLEKMVYYDQRGDILQTATFTDIASIAGRSVPTTVTIEDAYGDRTRERIEMAQFDIALDAQFFSLDTFASWGATP
jgi:hypothetical protein